MFLRVVCQTHMLFVAFLTFTTVGRHLQGKYIV